MSEFMICTGKSQYLKDKFSVGEVYKIFPLTREQARFIAKPEKFRRVEDMQGNRIAQVHLDRDGNGATYSSHSGMTGTQTAYFKNYTPPLNYDEFCASNRLQGYQDGAELGSVLELYELYLEVFKNAGNH